MINNNNNNDNNDNNDDHGLYRLQKQLLKQRKAIRLLEERRDQLASIPASKWHQSIATQQTAAAITIQRNIRGWLVRKAQPSAGDNRPSITSISLETSPPQSAILNNLIVPIKSFSAPPKRTVEQAIDAVRIDQTISVEQALTNWRKIKSHIKGDSSVDQSAAMAQQSLAQFQLSLDCLHQTLHALSSDSAALPSLTADTSSVHRLASQQDRYHTKLARYRWRQVGLIRADQQLPDLLENSIQN
jgi:hypothetical protein